MNLSTAAVNALADAFGALLDGGSIKVYAGTQPTDADTAVTSQTLLCTFTLPNPAFGSASNGTITLNTVGAVTAVATATATWARVAKSDSTVICDVTVGTANADVIINDDAVVTNNNVEIVSWTFTMPKA